ncbi:MAG: hypothetical protein JSS77_00235 [Acidobacteria bacterium]|nr:hypothetical protein [Acidobacteriota bacterium]
MHDASGKLMAEYSTNVVPVQDANGQPDRNDVNNGILVEQKKLVNWNIKSWEAK